MVITCPAAIILSGFDELPYAAEFSPVSVFVAQQTRTIGVIAAQLLLDKLEGKRKSEEHQTVVLQPELIVRAPVVRPSRGVNEQTPRTPEPDGRGTTS